ncbi:putative aminodeoxychorismate lyase [Zancudomyces culisetae]|uniref:Putative aminodeoxychorismate lyase n=1 Tax=Zancudomyces culisetae TaxID=1213189 RepID=A0A1R1PRX4_ZANCU|nr:putative aminodeoxychorismate lyase [Zancudomyces culisetae]|eukprot:OMH83736.1 putative aminodeoxychorismate lyase [Zancudomyces culisetae]
MLNAASYFQKYWAHTPEKPFENIPSKDELKKAMLDVLHSQVGQFKPTDVIATRIMMDTKCQLSAELSVFHDVTKAGGNKKVVIDKEPINTNSPFVKNKTTHRDIYNMSRERNGVSFDGPIFDAILHNEDGEITESTIANVAIKVKQDQDDGYVLVTPIKDSGLIGGTMRRRLLENKAGKWGKMIEGKITVDQLKEFIGVEGIDGASSVAEEQPKEIEEQQLQEKIIDKGEETKIINEIDSILESKISQIGLKRARTLTIGDNRAQSHPPLPSQSSSLLEPSEQGQGGSKEGDGNMMNGNTKNSEDQNGDETEIARIKRARTESPKMAARDVVVEIERRISNVEAEENSNTPVEGVEEGEKGGEKEKEKETEDKTRNEEEKKLEVEQRAIVGQGAEEAENVETETETGEGEEAGSGAVEMENIEVENKTNGLENMEVEKKEEEKTSEEVEIKTEAKVVEDVEMVEDDGRFLLNNNDRKDKAGSADTADELEHDGQQYIDLGVPYKDQCSANETGVAESRENDMEGVWMITHADIRYGQQDGGVINTEDTDDMIGKRTELGRCSQNQKAKSSGSIQHVKLIQQTNPNLYNGGSNSKNDNDNDNEDDSKKLLEFPIVALVISHIDNSSQESQNIENDIGIESNVLQFYKTKLDKNQIVHVYKNNSININDICTSVESSGRGLVNNVQVFKPTVIISHKQGGDDNETKYERLGISLSDGKYLLSNGCIDDRIRFATLFEARDDGKYCTAVNENLNSAARVKIRSTGNHGASGATLEFLYLTREQYTTIHGSVGFAKILSAQLALNLLNNANSRDVVQVIKQHFDAANQDEEDLAIHLQSVLVHSGDLLSRVLFEKNDGSANLESWIFTPTSSTFTIFRKYFELSSTILAQCKFPPSSSSVNNDPKKNTLVVAATNLKIFLEFSSILFNYQRLQRSSLFSLEYKQQQLVKFANWALTLLNFLVKETFLESKFHASLASRSEDTTNKPLCTSALLITPISLKIISDVLAFIINFLTFISSLSQSQPQTNINPNNALLQFSQYVKRTFPLQPKTLLSIVNSISQHVNNTTFAPASTYSIFDLLIKNTDPSHHNHDLRSLIFSSIQSQISSEFASDSTLLLDLIKFKNKNLDSLLVSSQHSSTPELVNNPNANPSYSIELPLFGSSSSTRSLATINSSSDPSSATPANPKPGYSLPSINMPNISLFNTPINTHNQLNYVGLQR